MKKIKTKFTGTCSVCCIEMKKGSSAMFDPTRARGLRVLCHGCARASDAKAKKKTDYKAPKVTKRVADRFAYDQAAFDRMQDRHKPEWAI